jgi:glycosyltransferase family protein
MNNIVAKIFNNLRYLYKIDLKKISKGFPAFVEKKEAISLINCYLDNLKYEICDEVSKNKILIPTVKNRFETLDKITQENVSMSRFGDGEFMLMCGESIPFQEHSRHIEERLKEIIKSENDNIIICIADFFGSLEQYTESNIIYWRNYLYKARSNIYSYLNFSKTYYDACVTRPYINYKDKTKSVDYFNKFKSIFKNKNIIVVEGDKTRLGVGNDLFSSSKSLKRIICPSVNAFNKYNDILDECKKQGKDKLFIISLGPTATVLSYDLTVWGAKALDTGHLDIEYEWFLMGANERVAIKEKYTYEAGGTNIKECNDIKYLSQILKVIA